MDNLATQARLTYTSIAEVTASSLVLEDYSPVVDHCMTVVEENPSVQYIVITRRDGFSLLHRRGGWSEEKLYGLWRPYAQPVDGAVRLIDSTLVGRKVFHASHRFSYSGIEWGWIHIGLSPEKFYRDQWHLYSQLLGLALVSISIGFLIFYVFAKRLNRPIVLLDEGTRRLARGDLSARVTITTGDELESLGYSFNQMAEALQRSQGELLTARNYTEKIIRSMHDMLLVLGPDLRIKSANPASCKILGYAEEELVGRPLAQILSNPFAPGEDLSARIEKGGVTNQEARYRTKDGRCIPVLLSGSVMKGESGRAEGFVAIAVDITEHKRNEEQRRQLEIQVQQAQKLESLGILAGGIAHDFNNLLMTILGNADLALMDLREESPVRHSLEEIETAAKHGADLSRQMLAYSGKGKFVVEAFNLNEVVQELGHLLEVSISKKAMIKYQLSEDLPAIEADLSQIRQVVMNLITNASEALEDREGWIVVSTGVMECDTASLHQCLYSERLPEGTYVSLEVIDTGCGMDVATQEKIFDPFFTTKFTGRGLGLAAVLGIVRGHKGAIRIDSAPDKGTTFQVLVPAVAPAASRPSEKALIAESWRNNGTVLLVDDDESVRDVAKRMLESAGLTILAASDGCEAVEVFRRRGDAVSCVLLDLTMPKMDGSETFQELRRMRPDVRVILSSGYSEEEIESRIGESEMAAFIQKPYNREQLIEKVKSVLAH